VTLDRGGPAHVKVWSGAMMASGGYIGYLPLAASFYAFPPTDAGGARLAMRDLDGDGRAELVAASGNPLNSMARVFNYEQAVLGGAGAPISYPLGTTLSYDGVYAGLSADTSEAPARLDATSGDTVYQATTAPVTHQCNCGACHALAQLLASKEENAKLDELFPTVSVM
jgi:hypothetical protein